MYVLNGLGSRGVMIGPYVAKELYNFIGDSFMECATFAERPHVEFQRFEFNTFFIRLIFDFDGGKIRLAGFRTQTSEFRNVDNDGIIPFLIRVNKCF